VPARDFVSRYFPGDYHIVPNGIDTHRFRPDHVALPELRTPGWHTLLFVGRLEQRKGLPTLLEAYAELRRRRPNVRLVVVGDGPGRWGYERYVEAEAIPDVLFLGHVESDMLPRCYASADVFCAPAVGRESFGIVLLEAMASGVPVLASAIKGFSQVITHGTDGLLVPVGDAAAWATALDGILGDDARRHAMGRTGLQTSQRYDWARIVDMVLDVYAEARGRARRHTVAAGVHEQVPGLG
jgi:phosphatidylinositol alpha-mannosyltransferase